MSKHTQLAKNTAILGIGKASTMLISLILLPLYTIYLSPGEFGVVDLIVTYTALLVPILTIQLDRSAFRFLIDSRGDEAQKKKIISSILFTATVAVTLGFGLYLIVSQLINVPYFILIPFTVASAIYSNLFLQFARGLGKNKLFAKSAIASGLMSLASTLLFVVHLNLGASGMLLAIMMSNLTSALFMFFSLKLYRYIKLGSSDKKLRSEMLKYSLPLIPSVVSWWIINVSDRTIVTIFLGIAENGIYAVANKYALVFMAVYSVFDMSWTESASVHINSADRDKFFSDIYNTNFKLFGALGVCMISTMSLFFNILVGAKFSEAYNYIPILVVAAFFNSIVSMFSVIYIAKKMTNKVAVTSIASAVINLLLNLLLIRYIGLYAAALSTAVAFFIMAIFRGFDIKKYVTITYEKNIFVKITCLYILIISLYYLNNPAFNSLGIIFAILFSIILNKQLAIDSITKLRSFKATKL